MDVRGVADVVDEHRAAWATCRRPTFHAGREHEVVEEQLAASLEKVAQARLAALAFEHVVLFDPNHRQAAALGGELTQGASHRLLPDQEPVALLLPLGARDNRRKLDRGRFAHQPCSFLIFGLFYFLRLPPAKKLIGRERGCQQARNPSAGRRYGSGTTAPIARRTPRTTASTKLGANTPTGPRARKSLSIVVISSQKTTLSWRRPPAPARKATRVGPRCPPEKTGTTTKSSRIRFRMFSETTTAGRD